MNETTVEVLFRRAALIALPAILAACASKPLPPPPAPVPPPPPPIPAPAPAPMAAPAPAAAIPEYLDPNSPISQKRSVYFDFDSSSIRADGKPVVELQGQYLAKHPDLHVRVEGNTDERGGSEYNLALGQRRAQAVKSALQIYGVQDAQVEPVSFGKEKPRAPGHDEDAWAQNRRADIAYPQR